MAKALTSARRDDEPQKLGPPIDILETLLLGVARFRFWIIPFTIIGLCVGIAMALITPNRYASAGKLWVQWESRETLSIEKLVSGSRRQTGGRGGMGMVQELTLLKTPEFFERIAREVGPDRLIEKIDPTRFDTSATPKYVRWQHMLQDWWFNGPTPANPEQRSSLNLNTESGLARARAMIQRGLRLRPSGMNVLGVNYSARSPELAQDVVTATLKVAIARHREMFAERFHGEFVSAQLGQAQSDSELASGEYYKHKKDCGFYDLQAQRATQLRNRNEIELALERGERELGSSAAEHEHYTKRLETTEPKVVRQVPAKIGPNPLWRRVNDQIQDHVKAIASLSLRFPPESENYIKNKRDLEMLIEHEQSELEKLDRNVEIVSSYEEEVDNPRYVAIQDQISKLDLRKTQILNIEVKYRDRLDIIDDKLDAITACEPKHRQMQEQISRSRARANQFEAALNNREALEILDQDEKLSNMWTLIPASYSAMKVAPKRGKEILQGLGGGVAAGLVFGVLRQLLDRKLRYPSTVQKMLGVRILGVIPEQRRWKRLGKKLKRSA